MPRIATVTTAVPPHRYPQSEVREFVSGIFADAPYIDTLLSVYDNAMIDERYFVEDIEWFKAKRTFTETNERYIEAALELSSRVATKAAYNLGIETSEFDAIIFVSTTGLATPTIDARMFNTIGLNSHIVRIPLWGLGCAGGAGGIARATDFARAHPDSKVLVVALELCSLAFQPEERSKSNIIATALFGDGAAAAVVVGDDVVLRGGPAMPRVRRSLSTIYPNSLDVMGWEISSDGFRVVLSRDIPSIVSSLVKSNIEELLDLEGLLLSDLQHYVAHPGGKRVLEAYGESLGIGSHELRHSIEVLRSYGNMSSATVFFILERFLNDDKIQAGEFALLSALGPGFSSELVLLEW